MPGSSTGDSARHAGASQQEYARQSQLTTGARSWTFGDIPERQETGPRQQVGYPALVDEGDTVGLRAFATPPEAEASHLRGTTRLMRLVMARGLIGVVGLSAIVAKAANERLRPQIDA